MLLRLGASGFSVSDAHRLGINTNVHLHVCTTEHVSLVKFTLDCKNNGRISAFALPSCTQQKELKPVDFLFLIFTEKSIFSIFGSLQHLSARLIAAWAGISMRKSSFN